VCTTNESDNIVLEYRGKQEVCINRSETDSAVKFSHMVVNTLAFWERVETDPTCVRVAAATRHMVAPFRALNGRVAAWALLHIMRLHPFLEKAIAAVLAIRAGNALVIFDMARRAYACEARGAGYS
jgi:hypothetical protein